MGKVYFAAFYAWLGAGLLVNALLLREELGIIHWAGLQPITNVAVFDFQHGDPRLVIAVGALGLVWFFWWGVHVYRRLFGDLKKRNASNK